MASLREIKDRIASVRSTLKITSAMKIVSAAKLHKAQKSIENMRPYEEALSSVLHALPPTAFVAAGKAQVSENQSSAAVVAISSNNSLCGGFNANIVRKTQEIIVECGADVTIFPIGKKMTEAMKKNGCVPEADYSEFLSHPSYDKISALAHNLMDRFEAGEFSKVLIVYNSFKSVSTQIPRCEQLLPSLQADADESQLLSMDYIFEPTSAQIAASLFPKVIALKLYTAVLDSIAAEQAARTVAMQTATDNAEDLLGELSLEYNKGRQQKITAEILDLLGGVQ